MYKYDFQIRVKSKEELTEEKRRELLTLFREQLDDIVSGSDDMDITIMYKLSMDDVADIVKNLQG